MASTSHDFWLANLGARTWKALHMLVYVAYFLVLAHVFLGAFQQETSPLLLGSVGAGALTVISPHLIAGFKQTKADKEAASGDEFEYAREPRTNRGLERAQGRPFQGPIAPQ